MIILHIYSREVVEALDDEGTFVSGVCCNEGWQREKEKGEWEMLCEAWERKVRAKRQSDKSELSERLSAQRQKYA